MQKINYEANNLQKFIIKHYTFNTYKKTISNNTIHKDYLIYTNTNQSCYDLYFQFFLEYFPVLKEKILGISQKSEFDELNKMRNEIKDLFDKYFKNFLEEENKFSEDIFDEYPDIPFFLKLKLYKSKINKFIPKSKKRKFKKILNQLEKENKILENKKKSQEGNKSEEEKAISIEINNNANSEITSISDNSKEKEYNPICPIDLSPTKFPSKMDIVLENKEKNKEKENKSNENNINNNDVHSIIIVFNPKYLNTDSF